MSCSDGRWCTRAEALLGVEGIPVNAVTATASGLVLHVETGVDPTGCPECGAVMLLWAKRGWRYPDQGCPRTTYSEDHAMAGPRAKLTIRAAGWATNAPQQFDSSVSALAHQLGVSWHTVWNAVESGAAGRILATGRLAGVDALGADEHVWSRTRPPGTGIVTGIVDITCEENSVVHARLLDLVPGRCGKA